MRDATTWSSPGWRRPVASHMASKVASASIALVTRLTSASAGGTDAVGVVIVAERAGADSTPQAATDPTAAAPAASIPTRRAARRLIGGTWATRRPYLTAWTCLPLSPLGWDELVDNTTVEEDCP